MERFIIAKSNRRWEREYMMFEDMLKAERNEGLKEGIELGREEGRADERTAIAMLADRMNAEGRGDELIRALSDVDCLERLFAEYGIVEE